MAKLIPDINIGLHNFNIFSWSLLLVLPQVPVGSEAYAYYTEHYFSEEFTKRGQTHFHFSEMKFKNTTMSELSKVSKHAHSGVLELIQGVLLVEKCYIIRKSGNLVS